MWPLRSRDVSILDFGFGVYLKNKVCAKSIPQLRAAITAEMQAIPANMLQNATMHVVRIAQKHIEIYGRLLEF